MGKMENIFPIFLSANSNADAHKVSIALHQKNNHQEISNFVQKWYLIDRLRY